MAWRVPRASLPQGDRGFESAFLQVPSSTPRLTTPVAGVPRIQPPLLQRDQLFAPECLQDAIDVYGGQGTRRASGEEICELRWASISELYRLEMLGEKEILPPGL
jgi:hypothetical protein